MDNLELHLGQPFVAHPGEPPSNMLSDFLFWNRRYTDKSTKRQNAEVAFIGLGHL